VVNLSDTYQIRSNRESGYGRYDVMMKPKDRHGKAFIKAGSYQMGKGRCMIYGNGNIGNTGNSGNRSQRFPDQKVCILRTGYGGKEAEILLSGQFSSD